MKKYNFNKDVLGLDGKALLQPVVDERGNVTQTTENINLGKLLARNLVGLSKGDILKLWGWAQTLQNGDQLSLDESDKNKLKEIIENQLEITILAKAQMLEVIK